MKKGRLSETDKALIEAKMNKVPAEDIAAQLDRKPETIQKYIDAANTTVSQAPTKLEPGQKRGDEVVDKRIGKVVGAISTQQSSERADGQRGRQKSLPKYERHIHRIFKDK